MGRPREDRPGHVDVHGDEQAAHRGGPVIVQQPLGPLPRRGRGPEHRLDHRADTPANGVPVPFFTYRSTANPLGNDQQHNVWRASMSYVTGSHSLKVGYQAAFQVQKQFTIGNPNMISYTFFGGAALVDHAVHPEPVQQPHALRRVLRPGSVDGESLHGAGRASIRARVELVSGGREWRAHGIAVHAQRVRLPALGRCHGL